MNQNSKNSKKKESNRITLLALKEINIVIDEDIAKFNIGITDTESMFMRITDKNSYYEALFSFLEIQQITLDFNNKIGVIYDWFLSKINYNQCQFYCS